VLRIVFEGTRAAGGDKVTAPARAEIKAFSRQFNLMSCSPDCSCRMGRPGLEVADPPPHVRGPDGVRICDRMVLALVGPAQHRRGDNHYPQATLNQSAESPDRV